MKRIILSVFSLLACLAFQSCNEEEIMYYEGGNAVHFLSTSISDSFITDLTQETRTLSIPVQLVGNISEKDLTFSVKVLEDEERTTATTDQYDIISCTVPAGETEGRLNIELKNPDMLNIDTKTLKLALALVDNEEVKAGGWRDFLEIDLTWSSDYVQPKTWRAFYFYVCKKFSPAMYRAYIAATGYTECYLSLGNTVDPETGAYWSNNKGYAIGKKFGDWIRQWEEENGQKYLHDGDYEYSGTPVEPLW